LPNLTIRFEEALRYLKPVGHRVTGPFLEVALLANGKTTLRLPALVDSGSQRTLFQAPVAVSLGIDDVTEGVPLRMSAVTGLFTAYLFDVELELDFDNRRLPCQIGFADIPRHILGRDVLFHEYLLAFAEREELLYYRREPW
jgi:hypothetical protein